MKYIISAVIFYFFLVLPITHLAAADVDTNFRNLQADRVCSAALSMCEMLSEAANKELQQVDIIDAPLGLTEKDAKTRIIMNIMGCFPNPIEVLKRFISVKDDGKRVCNYLRAIEGCEHERFNGESFKHYYNRDKIKREWQYLTQNVSQDKLLQIAKDISLPDTFNSCTTLTLGCGHTTSCLNHKEAAKQGVQLTIDANPDVNPDICSHFENPKLWEAVPDDSFDTVIFEGAGSIEDRTLMVNVFKKLKSGGVFKTLHTRFNVDFSIDDPMYNSTKAILHFPLATITVKEYLISIGFTEVKIYRPNATDDLDQRYNKWHQLCATKPLPD